MRKVESEILVALERELAEVEDLGTGCAEAYRYLGTDSSETAVHFIDCVGTYLRSRRDALEKLIVHVVAAEVTELDVETADGLAEERCYDNEN